MTDNRLFQEIDDEMERQKLEAFWRRFGPFILAAATLAVVATASISGWQSWRERQQMAATDALYSVMAERGDHEEDTAKALGDFTSQHPDGDHPALAQLQLAALAVKHGDGVAANAAWQRVMADKTADPALRQLATLYYVRQNADNGDKKALLEQLQPLLAEGAAFRPAAAELAGHLALTLGDKVKAQQYFSSVAQDAAAPQGMSRRANAMLRYLANTAPQDVAK